jgi:integrase
MTRKREQKGQIVRKGGQWFLRVYESRVIDGEVRRVRAAKPLGLVATRGKRPPKNIADEAEQKLQEINHNVLPAGKVLTIGDFMERVYFPMAEREKRPSTVAGYKDIWNAHLKPRCTGTWLKDVQTYHVQGWLDDIAHSGEFGQRTLLHIKSMYSGIFSLAIRLGYMGNVVNPARETRATGGAEPQETYAYSLDEILAILAALPEPAGTVFALAAFTGLRRGEIAGLLWEDYRSGEIRVSRSIWEGIATDPKTRRSRGAVPIIRPLEQRLEMYRLRSGSPESGPMFRNSAGTPLNLNNLLGRVILPTLNRCEICHKAEATHENNGHEYKRDTSLPEWHGWHACRRGLGSNLYALGIPEKVIQEILRHANVSTTVTYYVKPTSNAARDAMAKLEGAVSLMDPDWTLTKSGRDISAKPN